MHFVSNSYNYWFKESKNYVVFSNNQFSQYSLNRTEQFLRGCGLFRCTHKNIVINQVVEYMFTNQARSCENPQIFDTLLTREIVWRHDYYIPLKIMMQLGMIKMWPSFKMGIIRRLWPEPSLCVLLFGKFINEKEPPLFIATNRAKKEIEISKNNIRENASNFKSFFTFEMIPQIKLYEHILKINEQEYSTLNCRRVEFDNISKVYGFSLINLGNNQFLFVEFGPSWNECHSNQCPFTAALKKEGYFHSKREVLDSSGFYRLPAKISGIDLKNAGESLKYLVNSFQTIYRDLRGEDEVNIYYAANSNAEDQILDQFGWDPKGQIEITRANCRFNLKLYRLRESFEITESNIYFGMALGYTPQPLPHKSPGRSI